MIFSEADLSIATKHVMRSEQRIADQERLVGRLAVRGASTRIANGILHDLRNALAHDCAHRDEVRAGLATSSPAIIIE